MKKRTVRSLDLFFALVLEPRDRDSNPITGMSKMEILLGDLFNKADSWWLFLTSGYYAQGEISIANNILDFEHSGF